jgi:DNA-binding transcriptional MerR regulator
MFDVSKSLIRYWETEFNYLKPHKNSKGDRRFTPQNLDQLQLIYHLVKEREFTINGAREEIKRLQKVGKEKKRDPVEIGFPERFSGRNKDGTVNEET